MREVGLCRCRREEVTAQTMYHKKWRRQNAQLRALVESSDSDENPGPSDENPGPSDENPGPSFSDSPKDIQTQEQSDTGEDEYRDDHHPPDSDGESDSEIGTLSEEESSDLRSDLAKWAVKNKVCKIVL
ncbi:clumping factor B-like [Micropterus dolomieu]|uniref:clumping factor B-like n=1 Tax=Micropterus dolomieu TaxID=147949 RepID=UPI001E8CAE74|nr:clumping factor B-like [Micropterus dolomieu]